jgi:hypothetical protein
VYRLIGGIEFVSCEMTLREADEPVDVVVSCAALHCLDDCLTGVVGGREREALNRRLDHPRNP